MTALSKIELYKPALSELDPHYHVLPVPWEADAIQLNVVVQGGIAMGPLSVMVGEGIIDFSRIPNQKFQIHDNTRPVGTPEQREQTEVLARPVCGFSLLSCIGSEDMWQPDGDGLSIVNMKGFNTFLGFIFLETYKQQHPDATVAEITEIFDQHSDL